MGQEPREGQFHVVEMDSLVAERSPGAAMVAELGPSGPITAPNTAAAGGAIELRGLTKR